MKTIHIAFAILMTLAMGSLNAQFTKANLQASGLTCAMCSKAIDNALRQLSFIESVKPDIKNSAFNIVFKEKAAVDIDALKNAVEDAGFFVAKLKITGSFANTQVKNDQHLNIAGSEFHFVNVSDQVINGEKEITVVDKNFLTAAAFKKYSAATSMPCIKTGKAGNCCEKAGVAAGTRIFHVTI